MNIYIIEALKMQDNHPNYMIYSSCEEKARKKVDEWHNMAKVVPDSSAKAPMMCSFYIDSNNASCREFQDGDGEILVKEDNFANLRINNRLVYLRKDQPKRYI